MREGRGDGLTDDADWSVGVTAACRPTAAAAAAADVDAMVMTARRSPHQFSPEFTKADVRRLSQSLASQLRQLRRVSNNRVLEQRFRFASASLASNRDILATSELAAPVFAGRSLALYGEPAVGPS